MSKKTGLSIKAIRLYEQKGLIDPPNRLGRYRVYDQKTIDVLRLIAASRKLGVTLAQMQGIIQYRNGKLDWQKIDHFLAKFKLQLLEQQRLILEKIAQVDDCRSEILQTDCPEIAA